MDCVSAGLLLCVSCSVIFQSETITVARSCSTHIYILYDIKPDTMGAILKFYSDVIAHCDTYSLVQQAISQTHNEENVYSDEHDTYIM